MESAVQPLKGLASDFFPTFGHRPGPSLLVVDSQRNSSWLKVSSHTDLQWTDSNLLVRKPVSALMGWSLLSAESAQKG